MVFKKEQIPWIKGKKMSQKTKQKQREAKLKNPTRYWLGKGEQYRIQVASKRNYKSGFKSPKHSEFMKQKWQNPEYREKLSKIRKERFNKPDMKAHLSNIGKKGIKAIRKPTSLEKEFMKIIQNNNLPYKYTGRGDFWIGNHNPDFVNVNGQKICIEVRSNAICRVLQKKEPEIWEKEIIKHYQNWGWKCFVFRFDRLEKRKEWILNEQEVLNNLMTGI